MNARFSLDDLGHLAALLVVGVMVLAAAFESIARIV